MNARIPTLALGFLIATAAVPLRAADSPAPENDLKAKETEVQRLKQELQQRETELEKLRRENETLRKEKARAKSATPSAPAVYPATLPEPSRPLTAVAPPSSEDVFNASDLVVYFTKDPAAAAARFVGQRFLIRGVATRFEGVILQRRFHLEFESPSPDQRIRASVVFPPDWNGVFAAGNEASLVRRGDLGNRTLLQRGDTVTIRARCEGIDGEVIRFDRGELVKNR